MKVMITYEYDPGFSNQYWAKTLDGRHCSCGRSYTEAKENLIKLLKARYTANTPPSPEEVEI